MDVFQNFSRTIKFVALSLVLIPSSAMAAGRTDFISCLTGPNFKASEGFNFSFDLENSDVVLRNYWDGTQGEDFRVLAGEIEGGALYFTVEMLFENYVEMRDEIYIDLTEMTLVVSGNLFNEDGSFAGAKADLAGICRYMSAEEFAEEFAAGAPNP